MSSRFSNTDKWDDDWYLNLPPRMKCAWQWLCDTCNGAGIKKISFTKISHEVGEPISRADFDQFFSNRIEWIGHESVWIVGFIRAQYKGFSAKNKANVNVAKMALRELGDISLSEKASEIKGWLKDVVRASDEIQPTLIGNRKKEIGNRKRIKKGGVGENNYTQEFEQFWNAYPRKSDKSTAFESFLKNVFANEQDSVLKAAAQYSEIVAAEGRELKHVKHAATFLNKRKWLDVLTEKPIVKKNPFGPRSA